MNGRDRWHLRAPASVPTIAVIERTADDAKRAEGRDKEREKNGARKAAFGFARVLEEAAEETDT